MAVARSLHAVLHEPRRSCAEPLGIGDVTVGQAVCRVESAQHPDRAPGTLVPAPSGWCTAALGTLGMPGQTADAGLAETGRPEPGETVVVAAACQDGIDVDFENVGGAVREAVLPPGNDVLLLEVERYGIGTGATIR